MFTPITGRSVVVTGGTKGIGKGIARVFARAGANVVITGRDAASGEGAAGDLSGLGGTVSFARGDVSDRDDCVRVIAEAVERNGGLDVLCANAGIFPMQRLTDMTEGDIDAIFGTNVKGCMLSVRAALPEMTCLPSGVKAALKLIPSWPARRWTSLPVSTLQRRRSWSCPPVRMYRPPGEKAAA